MLSSDPKKRSWLGWCLYDWANSGFATVVLSTVLPVYFVSLVPEGGADLSALGIGRRLPAAALWGYAVSLSMLLAALFAPWLGCLADRHNRHRLLLLLFCVAGAGATALLAGAGDSAYLLAAGLFIAANFCFALGNVFYNAFLPKLAAPHELDRLSARGFAWGYGGGGLLLAVAFALIQFHDFFGLANPAAASRFVFLLTGLWWFLFALPFFFFVRQPAAATTGKQPNFLATLVRLGRFRDLLLFLLAFLFYNDGIETIIVVAAVYGREELGMSQSAILGCFLLVQFTALPGTLLCGRLAERFGPKKVIATTLVLFCGVTVSAFFMKTAAEFWVLSVAIALIFGGSQAVSRSLFGSLIPAAHHAEFYGFYAISGKFASIFGPLLFALVASWTGSARLSILALSAFFVTGLVFLSLVNVERGRAQAGD